MIDYPRIRNDLLALGLLALAVFVGFSLVSYDPADPPSQIVYPVRSHAQNWCGSLGAQVAHTLRTAFGVGAYFVVLSMVSLDVRLFSRREDGSWNWQFVGSLLSLAALCLALQVALSELAGDPIVDSGGYLGAWGIALLERHFTLAGSALLIGATLTAGLLLAPETYLLGVVLSIATAPLRIISRVAAWFENRTRTANAGPDPEEGTEHDSDLADDPEAGVPSGPERKTARKPGQRQPIKVNPPVTAQSDRQCRTDREEIMSQLDQSSLNTVEGEHELPDVSLLDEAEDFPYELLAKKARVAAITLEKTFQDFGLNVRVVEIDTGPVITQFELELEAGLRLSKVTALADDLAIALRVSSVRIVTSIPGKNTVGVEVPNDKRVQVHLRELIEAAPREVEKYRLPLFLGKDVSGRPLCVDMTKMPHLLIAGRTGTGKSVCLNTVILSMLMTRSPEDVKMILIDPKMVELSPYKRIPHLMHPVITDMKKAEAVLAWAVDKMEERYDLLARCGVRHLDGYNKLGKQKVLQRLGIDPDSEEAEKIPERMPYVVIVADEMADMIMTSGKDVEGHIIRLAQKSRAVGIHLVLATQKPTVDVITGLIKSNLPARISFQVASRMDSRVVLDEMGAERLLGNGDMLYLAPGTSHLTRAQGTFISDEEMMEVIDFFSDQEPEYNIELAQISASATGGSGDPSDRTNRDDLYEQAVEIVIREGRGSVSLLQRALGIGYGRGARLIDYMAEDGIVGDYNGSQAREVLYTIEQWEALQAGHELEEACA